MHLSTYSDALGCMCVRVRLVGVCGACVCGVHNGGGVCVRVCGVWGVPVVCARACVYVECVCVCVCVCGCVFLCVHAGACVECSHILCARTCVCVSVCTRVCAWSVCTCVCVRSKGLCG